MEAKATKKYLAEFFGTFVLVFIGCGSAVIAGDKIGFLGIALAFGLAMLSMVYAIGPVSGCHINPAITISMLFAGKISAKDSMGYILAQILGAILGASILFLIAGGLEGYDIAQNGLGQNGYADHSPNGYNMMSALIAEIVLTFIFLLVIFGSTSDAAPKGFAGLSIGISLAFIHMVGIPITGTSVNPARSIGPAVLAGGAALSQLWLFIIAPIIGGILAAIVWKYLIAPKKIMIA
ncbi:MAG: aquaporin Z [Bacteroidales bacterium]|nr:aquaporin Z [Bacteroidales bacterium]